MTPWRRYSWRYVRKAMLEAKWKNGNPRLLDFRLGLPPAPCTIEWRGPTCRQANISASLALGKGAGHDIHLASGIL